MPQRLGSSPPTRAVPPRAIALPLPVSEAARAGVPYPCPRSSPPLSCPCASSSPHQCAARVRQAMPSSSAPDRFQSGSSRHPCRTFRH
eukprot:5027104-Prymnesium_polylepis.1